MTLTTRLGFGLPFFLATFLVFVGCGSARMKSSSMAAPAGMADSDSFAPEMTAERSAGFSKVNTDKALNTAGHVRAWTGDLLGTASVFRSEVYRLGGYVVNERLDFGDGIRARKAVLPTRANGKERNKAVFAISLPIEELPIILDWLRGNSRIVEQYLNATRDAALPTPAAVAAGAQSESRQFLEGRLAAIVEALSQSNSEQERAGLEQERVVVARELSTLSKAAVAIATPLVKYATLNVYFEKERTQSRFAASRIVPTLRTSIVLSNLLSKSSERDLRIGGAIGFSLPTEGPGGFLPSPLLEVAGYPATSEADAGVMATLGTGAYGRSTGDGARTWLNPFIGFRVGYAHLGNHAFVASGELGVEIFKSKGVALSASMRPSATLGKDSQLLLESGGSLSVAF